MCAPLPETNVFLSVSPLTSFIRYGRIFAQEDPEKAKIVMLKFYAGLTNEQVAEILNVNERTVRRQWEFAKAWLFDRISGQL